MLRLLGSPLAPRSDHSRRGIPRRTLLQAGGLGLLGLPAIQPATARESVATTLAYPGFGRAKKCLVLYIYGAWSQLDTFDPKPLAPAEIRGEFGAISTCHPGVQVGEHLPRMATVLDRCTVVRSMAHPWNIHAAAYTLTGNPLTEPIEGRQRHPDHWPYFGGVLDYLGERGEFAGARPGLPTNVLLPWRQSSHAGPNKRAGTFGGFLGPAYDPVWTEFHGDAPQRDPFREITPAGRFDFNCDVSDVTLDVLDRRRSLLEQFEVQRESLVRSSQTSAYHRQRAKAFDFIATPQIHEALRIDREAAPLRERYGYTLFGQACLAGRRLLEAGVPVVSVVWDEFGKSDESWDTHHDHHPRMREFLLPGFDQAFSTLLLDLETRGLLDETLVLVLSEHGRTPKFYATAAGAPGRDHWSRAYCQLFAGAGIAAGQIIGSTDAIAGDVAERPIDPKDILCTAYHLLGVDPRHELITPQGRPLPLVGGGDVVRELLA